MLKKNSGVTLVALITTIVVLVILAGVSLTSGYSLISETRVMRVISNMTLVKAKAEIVYEENEFSENTTELAGTEVSSLGVNLSENEKKMIVEKAKENASTVENIENWTWYAWDRETLKSQGLDYNMLSNSEFFYVNYEYGEIIYSKGSSINEKDYYYSMTGLSNVYENRY